MRFPIGQRLGVRKQASKASYAAPAPRERLLGSIAFVFLYIFVFSMPLENSIIVPGFGTIGRVVGVIAFIAGLLAVLDSGKFRSPTPFHLVMVVFVVWVALTYFWTIAPDETVEEIKSYVQLLAMVLLIWAEAPKLEQQQRLMQAYILGAGILACATILQNEASAVGLRQGAFNMNPNDIGLRIVISVPMALYLSAVDKSSIRAWLYRAQMVATACGLFFTASRGAFIAFLAALLMIPLTYKAWTSGQKLATVVLVIIASLAAVKVVPQAAWDRLGGTQGEIAHGTMDARTVIWHAGTEVFLEHPFLGIGAGGFPVGVQRKTATAWAAHNTFLSLLVELGIIGLGIFIVLFLTLAYAAAAMPRLERALWLVMLLTWTIGVSAMTWEYYKPTWFIFAMIAVQSAAYATSPARHAVTRGNRGNRGQPARVPKQVREFWNTTFDYTEAGAPKGAFKSVRGPR